MTPLLKASFFKQRHTKLLLVLVLLDLLATMVWFHYYEISELNPILSPRIESSLLEFALLKLALSLPSIFILNKFLNKKITQYGIGLLLTAYIAVSFIHYYIFISILAN